MKDGEERWRRLCSPTVFLGISCNILRCSSLHLIYFSDVSHPVVNGVSIDTLLRVMPSHGPCPIVGAEGSSKTTGSSV
ncbi:hypothetical protein LX36DRAFT_389530 [Colletotrichum falcatum]|nr:hypothetical protein LX36DRAFT_389530 [Colletotrichum falcatum]